MRFERSLVARGGIALAALAAAIVAGPASLSLAWAQKRPAEALRLDPRQPAALALSAYSALSDSATKASSPATKRAERDALKALSSDPTNVTAISSLALVRELDGHPRAAAGLMRYAERLSRRDLITQLWWIEYLSRQGDIPGTLKHYDVALRTSNRAPSILFPILVTASADPEIGSPLAALVAQRPVWAEQFVQQLAQSSPDPAPAAHLLGRMASLGAPASDRALVTVIDRLIQVGRGEAAWALYARYRPEAAQSRIRDEDFSAAPSEPTAFDWQLSQEGLSASADRTGLRIDASPGGGGVAARQLLRLVGVQRLRLEYTSDNAGSGAAIPTLTLRCVATGASISPTGGGSSSPETLVFAIPRSCPLQILEVVLQAADSPGGASALVRSVRLVD
ncbi:tetratricopeptide repeat protein [Sphingomonas sp. M1-B02]|uniref:tetratricopeptide repeat protein n=1 Tax=Sphingomonas sp. M1-B02 TaxID=3114300 RepID=UPI00223F21D4|nr:hypothetical protein [Sphingomonas sp. S6-11]UZK65048.1 hypothetical protein OKW87_11035 [Sphingomonas sp. S6-11]